VNAADPVELTYQVPTLQAADELYAFAESLLAEKITDPTERMFESWKVPWRREALNHYLPLGWSFTARDQKENLQGFFLGQPLLFFRGFTQNLWIETIQARTEQARVELTDVAVKVAREKHLQRVLFAESENLDLQRWKAVRLQDAIAEVATTKTK
jgi:hypothetical protein